MEKHANNSHLLPSTVTTDSACGCEEKKILWHYLNGFVSIGESNESEVQQLCTFETLFRAQ